MREYAIKLDKKRNLCYGMKELKKIEDFTKKKIVQLNLNEVSTDELIYIFWIGLTKQDPNLEYEQIDDLIDKYYNFGKLFDSVNTALSYVFGITEDTEGKNE